MAHTEFNQIQTYQGIIFNILCISLIFLNGQINVDNDGIQFKCKLKVFQSIVSLMLERDSVYSIQHFPNQHKLLQLLI